MGPSSPITSPPRFNSASPRSQTSTLTFALQEAGAAGIQPQATTVGPGHAHEGLLSAAFNRHDSFSNGLGSSYQGTGARPISVRDRPRRESNTAGSLTGMSWGGLSVGSFVRDDFIMSGTSPYPFHQSPSFHSSSYLPKLEAEYMRDFSCCGIQLASMHELLQHFEEHHAQPAAQAQRPPTSAQTAFAPSRQPQPPAQQHIPPQSTHSQGFGARSVQSNGLAAFGPHHGGASFSRTQLATVPDVDTLDDMEMDDAPLFPAATQPSRTQAFAAPSQAFGQAAARMAPLNVGLANTMQSHGLRASTPTTPSATQAFAIQHNPTVSSVNTPTLGTRPMQGSQSKSSPESSVPGTPAEFDESYSGNYASNLTMPLGMAANLGAGDWSAVGFGADAFNGTIDQPAKRLYSRAGGLSQQQLRLALAQGQLGSDAELAKRFGAQQALGAVPAGRPFAFPLEEDKPFKCPVIGCEKTYKNQNGLKYHKQHGHQNQRLQENEDGTFSIVDPVTSMPYPGTVGMEKEKPYKCDVCGKRYKNLNGLKYHRQHSPPCNPDLLKTLSNLNGNANVAGAGLAAMGDAFR